MDKNIRVYKNGSIHITFSNETMEEIEKLRKRYGLGEAAGDSIMYAGLEDIENSMEHIEGYCYGKSQLRCVYWASAAYYDFYYCFKTDMAYEVNHRDVYDMLVFGNKKTIILKGRKPYDDEDRADIMSWLADWQGWGDEDYDNNYNESEAV